MRLIQDDNILKLSLSNSGHHIITNVFKRCPEWIKSEIFTNVLKHFSQLAQDKNGLCVMKEIIKYSRKDDNKMQAIMNELVRDILKFAQHEFANYVVLNVITTFPNSISRPVYYYLLNNFTNLSILKYSSNLVEAAIDKADDELQEKIIEEFINYERLDKIVLGSFGNYVL